MRATWSCLLVLFLLFPVFSPAALAATLRKTEFTHRYVLCQRVARKSGIPWYYLAAVLQYESSLPHGQKKSSGVVLKPYFWCGLANPNGNDKQEATIRLFGGLGRDGTGDGRADPQDLEDALYSFALYMSRYGTGEENWRIALWNYYQEGIIIDRISAFARLYREYGFVDANIHVFPLPRFAHYSYKDTWGAKRGWGGRRIHEGTDLFAAYGTPVLATSFGYVEMMGWNKYGGWRIGIRDLNNIYHYYAHLASFRKGLKRGMLVKPGQIIGYVGSSGYGRPGTTGKFPPHLHYGMYRDTGRQEWAFDPYPYLRRWEKHSLLRPLGAKEQERFS